VKLLDLNLLLYAVNRDSAHHRQARQWLERTLNGTEPVALPWVVILGFLRVATGRAAFARPLTADQALAVVDGWLGQPMVGVLHPGPEHWRHLRELLSHAGTAGNLTTDAHLAALALENGCELCSTDTDFARFVRLKWSNPLAGKA
jgi:uncharacterized protein